MSNVLKGDYLAADEGKFFTSTQGIVASTALALTTTALAQVNPTVVVFNGQPPGGKNLYMRHAKLTTTTIVAAITSVQHVGILNGDLSAHTTVGTLMSTPANNNGSLDNPSLAKVWGGVNIMSTPAAKSRLVHSGEVDNDGPVALDNWTLVYGESGVPDVKIGAVATLVRHVVIPIPPVIVAPQQFYTLGFWGVAWAATAASYRIDVGWLEL
jgi:hypothetical protein